MSLSLTNKPVIGLIPAAGLATRLGPLPCSKEIIPIGPVTKGGRQQVVTDYLLDRYHLAGIDNVFIIIREGKWDIPGHFRDGRHIDMNIGYLMMNEPYGAPYTLNQAYPFIKDHIVALGFPDILFTQKDVYTQLMRTLADTSADVVLGLFPADRPHKVDMVETDAEGKVTTIMIKPEQTALTHSWITAVWTPRFSAYLNEQVQQGLRGNNTNKELYVGDVIQRAINDGLYVTSKIVSDQPFIDIGTPDDLERAKQLYG